MSNHQVILKVIPEPSPNYRNVKTIAQPEVTFFADDGNTNLVCGHCKAILASGIENDSLSNMVLRCNNCQHYNEIPNVKTARPAF